MRSVAARAPVAGVTGDPRRAPAGGRGALFRLPVWAVYGDAAYESAALRLLSRHRCSMLDDRAQPLRPERAALSTKYRWKKRYTTASGSVVRTAMAMTTGQSV